MVKKISFLLLSVAILVTGAIALRKLNYWDRSVRIFCYNSDSFFEGRAGRQGAMRRGFASAEEPGRFEGKGEFGERGRSERPEMRELPDSIRARFEAGRGRPEMRNRNIPDSLRQQFERNDRERRERVSFEGGFRGGNGRGRGDSPGGRKIILSNVLWFLAVFASFTVISIYIDKAYCLIRKRKERESVSLTE